MGFSMTPALSCKCQKCYETFKVNRYMTHTINIDVDDDSTIKFLTGRLNEVECPRCNSVFTYEIPVVVFSRKHRFAIRVNPQYWYSQTATSQPAPHYLMPPGFRFREVTFLIEANEKSRIFADGLDDRLIEYIKLKSFTDLQTVPFDKVNMVYAYQNNTSYFFKQVNHLNIPIAFYEITKQSSIGISFKDNIYSSDKWHIINRLTISNYLMEE